MIFNIFKSYVKYLEKHFENIYNIYFRIQSWPFRLLDFHLMLSSFICDKRSIDLREK